MTARCPRRALLAGAASLAWMGAAGRARAAVQARVVVAGLPGGRLDRLSATLAPALLAGLPPGSTLSARALGGEDGVTGANQFEARQESEGVCLLLLPGSAPQAWLAGDARAQFDPGRWVRVLCAVASGVLVGRRGLRAATATRPLVVAVPDPLGGAAAMLLGLDLLGVPAQAWRGSGGGVSLLRDDLVDAIYVASAAEWRDAARAGAMPLCSLGPQDAAAGYGAQASLPALLANSRSAEPALFAAWRAAAALAVLDYALVLPQLTPAATVALWREAGRRAAAAPALQPQDALAPRPLDESRCPPALDALDARGGALIAYRNWLARRLQFQPA